MSEGILSPSLELETDKHVQKRLVQHKPQGAAGPRRHRRRPVPLRGVGSHSNLLPPPKISAEGKIAISTDSRVEPRNILGKIFQFDPVGECGVSSREVSISIDSASHI